MKIEKILYKVREQPYSMLSNNRSAIQRPRKSADITKTITIPSGDLPVEFDELPHVPTTHLKTSKQSPKRKNRVGKEKKRHLGRLFLESAGRADRVEQERALHG